MSDSGGFALIQIIGVVLIAYAAVNIIATIPFMILFCLRKSLIESLKFKFPVVGFIGWAVLVVAFFAGGVAMIAVDDLDFKVAVAILAVAYVIYFLMVCLSPEYRSTCHKFDVSEFDSHLQKLRNTGVDLHFDIVASHQERTTHTDSNGNKSTSTKTVVTYRKTRYVPVPFWIDLTKPIVLPVGTPYIRIVNLPKIEWCHESEKMIEHINHKLYKKNKHRDDHVTVTTHYTVPGIIPNLLVRSPVMDPTTCQKVRINACLGLLYTIFGFGGIHSFILARSLPVVKHKVHKKASLCQPVVDDSWLKQYKVKGATMTPHGSVFGNVQMVDNWDCEAAPIESYTASQPMFVNPMPLYVTYDVALQYETPSAPYDPYCYMCYDPNAAQAGYAPAPADMVQPTAPVAYDPNAAAMAQPAAQPMPGAYDPNAAAMAQPGYDPNAAAAGGYPQTYVDPNTQTVSTTGPM